MAKEKAPIGEGAKAPRFDLEAQDGTRVRSQDLGGTAYVLFFYPKADTPGCTQETCGFRDTYAAFRAAGVQVYGVSPDPQARQAKFAAKFEVPFPLLCDTEHALAEAYGCWAAKSMYGKQYMGIERSTFLVGADGTVAKAWRKVKVAGHVEEVLVAAKAR
jgi:peroxiredoxin Q/BCP